MRLKEKLWILSAVLFIVIGGAICFYKYHFSKETGPKVITVVKGSIPLPVYQAKCSIYLYAKSQESEDFIRLDLSIYFSGVNGLECFNDNSMVLRDMIYRFLKDKAPRRNSLREWTNIVEGDLMEYIKRSYNLCRIKNIDLELLQRL